MYRLNSILAKRTLSPAKLDEVKIKANILSTFKPVQETDEEPKEAEETTKLNSNGASEKYTAAYHSAIKRSIDTSQDQHAPSCIGTRGASTPPATPPPELTQSTGTEAKPHPKSDPKPGNS